ncbi:hypothetical protein CRENBAI_023785 [Crenichthys baileyi]|uniref:Uncharacterized protein n=1 Tax=Crenichthys baileyi TaxID=28760 RepID=A0AAV9QT21_9TELE
MQDTVGSYNAWINGFYPRCNSTLSPDHRCFSSIFPAQSRFSHNSTNITFPPTTDPADKLKADALVRWVERLKEEAMRNLPTDLEVLPSPLLLEQMEREAAQRQRVREGCFVPPPQLRRFPPASVPAAKPSSFSRRRNRRRAGVNSRWAGEEVVSLPADVRTAASKPAPSSATAMSPRLAAAPPMPFSLAPAWCSEATPDELEQRLRFFAHQIKSFRRTSLMYSSPELMERIRQMEGDYETAVRQFYCRPPSTPGLQGAAAAAAEQPTSGLQSAVAEQPTSGLQSAVAELPTSGLQSAVAEQPTSGLQSAVAEQPTSGLQSAVAEQPTSGLQNAAAEQPTSGLQNAAAEQPTSGLQGAVAEQPTSGLQNAAAEQSTPRAGCLHFQVLSTFSVFSGGGCCKREASAQVIGGPGDASAPAHATEGLCDASAPAHVIEGPADASAPAPSLQAFQGFSEKLVLVLASEPCDEGFEEEAPPDPVSEGLKEQLFLILASEPCDEGFEEEAPSDPVHQALLQSPRVPLAHSLFMRPLAHWRPPELCACWGRPLDRCLNSVPAGDDLPIARLNSVPAGDDLPIARLNSVPAEDDLPIARLNFVFVFGPPTEAPTACPGRVVFV